MTVTAVERAFTILRAVPVTDGTLTAIARAAELPVSTTARLLATLEQVGALTRAGSGFRLGPALVALVTDGEPAYDLLSLSAAHLSALAAETGETAGIAEAIDTDLVHLAQVAADADVTVRDWTGVHVPAHSGAIGFAMMAHWEKDMLDEYLDPKTNPQLEAFSAHTLTSRAKIRARLKAIRADGFIWTTDEYAQGITTVAAPIRNRDGAAVGALHVHGPSYRFPHPDTRSAVESTVSDRAQSISRVLGWTDGRDETSR